MELSLVDRWICGAEVALRTLSKGSSVDTAVTAVKGQAVEATVEVPV